jgi:hypothetical protein
MKMQAMTKAEPFGLRGDVVECWEESRGGTAKKRQKAPRKSKSGDFWLRKPI